MTEDAVICSGVSKRYKGLQALDAVDLSVARGEIFGLLGPDGAGKTSLFRLIASLLIPDSGKISVFGADNS